MVSEQHSTNYLKNKLAELEKDCDVCKELLGGLRQQLRYMPSTDVQGKLRLKEEIKEADTKYEQTSQEMTALEKKLASTKKPTQPDSDDEFSRVNQEKFSIRVSFDNNSVQVPPDGFEQENTGTKAWTYLHKLKKANQEDPRVSDGLKDPERKIYKTGKNGEQILVTDNEKIYVDDILESRPDAIKG
jgi:hypothetical protein